MKVHLFALSLVILCLGTLVLASAPSITSFSPAGGPIGTVVTVNGHYLAAAPTTTVNGTAASVDVTAIKLTIAAGTTTGKISVTTPGGTATSATNFYVGNALPTITAIANQTINLNASTPALAFTVGDSIFPASSLTMTGKSSNAALFPTIRIIFSGSGAARTVTVTPAANQSGTANITLTVTDGGGATATTSFTVTVNAPPTITTIANQLINMGTATPALAFTVADDLTAASALTVTAASSNSSLVPPSGLLLTGPNASGICSLKATPVATYSGLATITLTVTDGGGLKANTSFSLTVNRPTITAIANQIIAPGTSTAALAFTVGDSITPVAALTVTGASSNYALVPNANIVFVGSGAARTVTVTPVAGKTGTVTITLTVKDAAGLTAKTSFIVAVGINPTDGAAIVGVPGGSFTMGSIYGDTGGTSPYTQQVTLSGYCIYKYPVTVAQYRAFCTATSHSLPAVPSGYSWNNINDWSAPELQQMPIVNVIWDDAQAYATWAGVQLPTEAQYEYAARGPQGNNYPWGGTATANDPNNGWDQTKCSNDYNSYSVGKGTWPVGSFPAGASWCGAQDLVGNMYEWCMDWYGDYSATPVTNPTGPTTGVNRVLRGGCWSTGEAHLRGVYRAYLSSGFWWYGNVGFRCVVVSPGP